MESTNKIIEAAVWRWLPYVYLADFNYPQDYGKSDDLYRRVPCCLAEAADRFGSRRYINSERPLFVFGFMPKINKRFRPFYIKVLGGNSHEKTAGINYRS